MSFIEEIKKRAKQEIKTIVLPEAEDIRILQATEIALKEKYANIVLIGNKEKILEKSFVNSLTYCLYIMRGSHLPPLDL